MAKRYNYPRACQMCETTYQSHNAYTNHKKTGACKDVANQKTEGLRKEITELKAENALLKAEKMPLPLMKESDEFIYIIQDPRAIQKHECVYLVGVISDTSGCLEGYPIVPITGRLFYARRYAHARLREPELQECLMDMQKEFTARKDYGSDYYEGDIFALIDAITNIMDDEEFD